jgi:hypothetical protein
MEKQASLPLSHEEDEKKEAREMRSNKANLLRKHAGKTYFERVHLPI